jgi:hypothetical protein
MLLGGVVLDLLRLAKRVTDFKGPAASPSSRSNRGGHHEVQVRTPREELATPCPERQISLVDIVSVLLGCS